MASMTLTRYRLKSLSKNDYTSDIKKCLFRIIIIFTVLFFATWNFIEDISEQIIGLTSMKLMTVTPFEMIQTELYICVFVDVILLAPYIVIEVYKFVSPALYDKEKKIMKYGFVTFYSMFILGATMLAYIFIKLSLEVLSTYYISGVNQTVSLYSYIAFLTTLSIACGMLLCFPVVTAILTYMGVLKSSMMSRYRKQFVIVSLFISAAVTPGPDVMSMLLMEIPLLLSYEFSIMTSKIIQKKT